MSFVTMELAREIENDRILEQLTNKIKKVIPEIEIEVFAGNKEMRSSITTVKTRPITLEDILRCLIERNIGFNIQKYGQNVISLFNNIDCYWELGKPLHEQSEETIKELNNLI
jgi:hypothetical protein